MALLLGLIVAAPVSAAATGTQCGTVTAYTAPTAVADGSFTMDGTPETIDATADVDANASAALAAAAAADSEICLDVVAGQDGVITSVSLASSFCGDVTVDTTTGAATVNGVAVPTAVTGADGNLAAVLDAAASANGDACLDVTYDSRTGAIVDASARVSLDQCGRVVLEGDGDALVGGMLLPEELIDSELRTTLQATAAANGNACVAIDSVTRNGNTAVTTQVVARLCLTVTAVSGNQVSMADLDVTVDDETAADVEVGQTLCLEIIDGAGGPVEFAGVLSEAQVNALGGGLPDTAMERPAGPNPLMLLGLMLIALGLGMAGLRVVRSSPR